MEFKHVSVLLNECIEALDIKVVRSGVKWLKIEEKF